MIDKKKSFMNSSPKPVPPPRVSAVITDPDEENEIFVVPPYLESVYKHRYFVHRFARFFQNNLTAAATNFFWSRRLVRFVADEIRPGTDVLQFGIADGKLQRVLAEKMSGEGAYHIEDISKPQVDALLPTVAPWLNVRMKVRDFTIPTKRQYDAAVLFFTLHELPDTRKAEVVKRAFAALKPSGKIIFVDYAKPRAWHPLKYPLHQFNRLFEPFAESLWKNEIKSFAPIDLQESKKIVWAKRTAFGGLYQCVIAQTR